MSTPAVEEARGEEGSLAQEGQPGDVVLEGGAGASAASVHTQSVAKGESTASLEESQEGNDREGPVGTPVVDENTAEGGTPLQVRQARDTAPVEGAGAPAASAEPQLDPAEESSRTEEDPLKDDVRGALSGRSAGVEATEAEWIQKMARQATREDTLRLASGPSELSEEAEAEEEAPAGADPGAAGGVPLERLADGGRSYAGFAGGAGGAGSTMGAAGSVQEDGSVDENATYDEHWCGDSGRQALSRRERCVHPRRRRARHLDSRYPSGTRTLTGGGGGGDRAAQRNRCARCKEEARSGGR